MVSAETDTEMSGVDGFAFASVGISDGRGNPNSSFVESPQPAAMASEPTKSRACLTGPIAAGMLVSVNEVVWSA